MKNIALPLIGLSMLSLGSQAEQRRPNFVIIIGDDCSYSDLSCYGSPNTNTANIDKLASEGMRFENCFQATGMSSPTRHCLYTGLYPVRSGAYPNHTFAYDNVKSFVQHFGAEGYRTALYGKSHVAPASVFSFDYIGDYRAGVMDFDKMQSYIETDSEKPFFMVVASYESHDPYTLGNPEKWDPAKIVLPPNMVDTKLMRETYARYLAEVEVYDSQVGGLMKMLDKAGCADNTVFMFLSEQGNSFPFAKWTCYNQGLHSGMIVRYPGVVRAGSVSKALVEYVDVVPTFMDIAGIKVDKGSLDGASFKPVLLQKTDEHKKYAYAIHTSRGINAGPEYYGIRSVTTKEYSYIMNLTPEAAFKNVVTSKTGERSYWQSWVNSAKTDEFARRQVEAYQRRPAEELYCIAVDQYSMKNLANDPKYAKIKAELKAKLQQWMKQQGDKGQQTELDARTRQHKGDGAD